MIYINWRYSNPHFYLKVKNKQGKSEGFDSCDRPSYLTQIGFKSSIFQPVWSWNLMDVIKKETIGRLFYTTSSFVHHFKTIGEFKLELQSGNTQFGSKSGIFGPVWLWNLILKNNRAPLLCYFFLKFCASFRSHWGMQTGVTVRKRPIWVKKTDDVFSRVTLKFDRWPCKNNGAPLLSNIKLFASFHHHMWTQTGITARKRLSWVLTSVTLIYDLWPWPFAWASL